MGETIFMYDLHLFHDREFIELARAGKGSAHTKR